MCVLHHGIVHDRTVLYNTFPMKPTREIYTFLYRLCSMINAECFDGALPSLLITIKGKGNVFGYYKYKAHVSHNGQHADELAVNPRFFASHGFQALLQTLGHEMTHQWQQYFGRQKSRRSYHNREFADKMISIGLIPSATGKAGGAQTGQFMADYMAEEGPIVTLFERLTVEGVYIPWYKQLAGKEADPSPELSPELTAYAAEPVQANALTVSRPGTTPHALYPSMRTGQTGYRVRKTQPAAGLRPLQPELAGSTVNRMPADNRSR